jgi:hypothetical protein
MTPAECLLQHSNNIPVGHDVARRLPQFWDEGHEKFVPFKLNDKVLLKVQLPGDLVINKFRDRFKGPFKILKVNPNNVTYEIGNPDDENRIYKVHHRQLKKWQEPPTYLTDNPYWNQLEESTCDQEEDVSHPIQRCDSPMEHPISTSKENKLPTMFQEDSDDEDDFEGFIPLPESVLTKVYELRKKLRNPNKDISLHQIVDQHSSIVDQHSSKTNMLQLHSERTTSSNNRDRNIPSDKSNKTNLSWNDTNISQLFPVPDDSNESQHTLGYDSVYTNDQLESDLSLNQSPSNSICARYVKENGISRLQIMAVKSDLVMTSSSDSSSSGRSSTWIRWSLLQKDRGMNWTERTHEVSKQHEPVEESKTRSERPETSSSFSFGDSPKPTAPFTFDGFEQLCKSVNLPSPIIPPTMDNRPRTRARGPCEQNPHIMSTPLEYRRPVHDYSDLYPNSIPYINNNDSNKTKYWF